MAGRYTRCQDHRDEITYHATTLAMADQQLAEQLAAKGRGLTDYIPARWSEAPPTGEPTIQAAGWKTGGGPENPDPTPTIGGVPVPPEVKAHEKPLPPPPPPPPPPTVEQRLDDMQRQLDEERRINSDQQAKSDKAEADKRNPQLGDALATVGGGCLTGATGAAIAAAPTGPVTLPVAGAACVVGGAVGLTGYLGGIWIKNAIEDGGGSW